MMIKFLTGHKRVATSLDKLNAGKDYLLINREAEAIETNKVNKLRRDAIIEFGKLTLEQMRKCLRLYGVRPDNMSNELIESTLFDLVDKQPKKFFTKWVDNKSKDTEYIIEEAIVKGIIRKERTQYYYGTDMIAEGFKFPKLVAMSKLNTSIFYTMIIAVLIYYLMKKTSYGYNFKIVGENSIFSRYAGINNKKYMIWAMIISGALCGIAGAFEVYGTHYRFLQNISKGLAFDGMLVSLIVKNNPVGIVLMSLFFAILKTGSNAMELNTGVPSELILVIQSVIILFIAGESGFKEILKRRQLNKARTVK